MTIPSLGVMEYLTSINLLFLSHSFDSILAGLWKLVAPNLDIYTVFTEIQGDTA